MKKGGESKTREPQIELPFFAAPAQLDKATGLEKEGALRPHVPERLRVAKPGASPAAVELAPVDSAPVELAPVDLAPVAVLPMDGQSARAGRSAARAAQPDAQEVLSVARLDRLIKRLLEGATTDVRVRGEVSGARRAGSGHVYFSLKDENEDALIDCVMYRTAPLKARQKLENGERVVLSGRVTMYPPRGRLQFIADDVLGTARGALLEALEKLKAKLALEGLFDPGRKKPLPPAPRTVAVLTSRDGAAIHDIVRVAFRRGRLRLILVPTPVQGAGAARRIARALRTADAIAGIDAIILARGGGSAEDLMAYNDEIVVRAIAKTRAPVVSAVGHEIDVTLADLAADHRAATPSQAAEMLVPDDRERRSALLHLERRLMRAVQHRLAQRGERLVRLRARLGEPRRRLLEESQRFDDLTARLERVARRRLTAARSRGEGLERRLQAQHPRRVLAAARLSLSPLEPRLAAAMRSGLAQRQRRLSASIGRLEGLSPLEVLARGYAIVQDGSGRVVFDAAALAPGDRVAIRLHRGEARATIDEGDAGDAGRGHP
jgi:exodeoxyribonuclease VII large subunit